MTDTYTRAEYFMGQQVDKLHKTAPISGSQNILDIYCSSEQSNMPPKRRVSLRSHIRCKKIYIWRPHIILIRIKHAYSQWYFPTRKWKHVSWIDHSSLQHSIRHCEDYCEISRWQNVAFHWRDHGTQNGSSRSRQRAQLRPTWPSQDFVHPPPMFPRLSLPHYHSLSCRNDHVHFIHNSTLNI